MSEPFFSFTFHKKNIKRKLLVPLIFTVLFSFKKLKPELEIPDLFQLFDMYEDINCYACELIVDSNITLTLLYHNEQYY